MPDSAQQKQLPVQLLIFGKDEMNLAEFPIARLGRNDTRLMIEYEGQIVKDGKILEQKWLVSGSAALGLPTEFAERVLIALMSLTAREGFTQRKVPFTIYRILKIVGLTHNQRNYRAVENALQQLVGVTIYSEGAFYDKTKDKRITTKKGFHLLEEYWLKSQETDAGVVEAEGVQGYIIWSERIWENFKAGYIKNLDTEFYYSLENTLARRLYRFLDKRMHYQNEYQIDVYDLAARLGMMPYPYPSRVVQKLQPAFDELLARDYLASAEAIKVGKYTRIKFVRSRTAPPALNDAADAPEGAQMALNGSEGMDTSEDAIAALLERYGTSKALRAIWTDILREFEIALPWESYSLIRDSLLLDIEDAEAVLGVTSTGQEWIEKRIKNQVLSKLSLRLKEQVVAIRFVPLVL